MKLFDVNWAHIVSDLRRWSRLPLPARRLALDLLRPSAYAHAHAFGSQLDVLLQSGLVRLDSSHRRAFTAADARPLVKVLRAMDRHRVFDEPSPAALVRYIEEHFTNAEVERLGGWYAWRGGSGGRAQLASLVASETWAGGLLAAESDDALAQWATDRGGALTDPPKASIELLRTVQDLARVLLESTTGCLSLGDLVTRAQIAGTLAILPDALYTGLEFLVVVAGLRGSDLEPMIGLWPPAVRELRRPGAQLPSSVESTEWFELPVLMEDMTTVLTITAAEPLRLRGNDLAVFAREKKVIDLRLVALPPLVNEFLGFENVPRTDVAAAELRVFGLADVRAVRGAKGPEPYLEPTPDGLRWLALTPRERLAALIDPMRTSKHRNPPSWGDDEATSFFPFTLPYFTRPDDLDLRAALTRAFLSIPKDGFTPLEEFLDYQSREANPFLDLIGSDDKHGGPGPFFRYRLSSGDPRTHFRALWKSLLTQFLRLRLVAFGGARVAHSGDAAFCFNLTDIGRYLLGASSRFEYGVVSAEVIVQPNFDIVFLAPAPSAEAELARFTQRVGNAPGVVFRITRASILTAAEAGATASDVLRVLRAISSKPLPPNVEHEIQDWLASVRRARVRDAMVIECADEETAHRVVAALGAKLRRLTPTLLEISEPAPKVRAALLRRLRGAGVFLDYDTQASAAKRQRASVRD